MKNQLATRFCLLLLAAAAIVLPACTTTEHDVEIHRYHTRSVDREPTHSSSRDFSVVNSYDRDSR